MQQDLFTGTYIFLGPPVIEHLAQDSRERERHYAQGYPHA